MNLNESIYLSTSRASKDITVNCSNYISSAAFSIGIEVIYRLNQYTLTVDNLLHQTTETFTFNLVFSATTDIPMAQVNITINPIVGPVENITDDYQAGFPLPKTYQYLKAYDVQGYYTVTYLLVNPVSTFTLTKALRVWDYLPDVTFTCLTKCDFIVRAKDNAVFEFSNSPRSGFKYEVDFDDGNVYTNTSDLVYYELNHLTTFENIYMTTGTFTIAWWVMNEEYKNANGPSGTYQVVVENEIVNLTVNGFPRVIGIFFVYFDDNDFFQA